MRRLNKQFGDFNKPRDLKVVHIIIDSLSRAHFYRQFPNTVNFLNNNLRKYNTTAFDFKLNNVMGNNSPPNIIP